jgi:histone deacetylase 1/2
MITRTRDNTRRPRDFPDHVALSATIETEPSSFTQANTKPEWRQAMALEINALALNNTWTLIPPLPNQQVVGCKWVYKIKRCADGSIERYKARLVAK